MLEDIQLVRLATDYDLTHFSCGDDELDGFLADDAIDYQQKFLANTTLMISGNIIACFFALAADSIVLTKDEKIDGGIKTTFSSFPALKIARLAADKRFQGQGHGTKAVEYCIGLALHLNDEHRHDGIACRFVTVDAYPKSAEWYMAKFGFVENERFSRKDRDTISLRLDVLPYHDVASGE